jgi:hypothetical protein
MPEYWYRSVRTYRSALDLETDASEETESHLCHVRRKSSWYSTDMMLPGSYIQSARCDEEKNDR